MTDINEQANTRRTLWIVLGVAGVAILAYGAWAANRAVKSAFHSMEREVKNVATRIDTTHHVAAGSEVFLDTIPLAPITAVMIVRPDTTPAAGGMLDSVMQTFIRRGYVVYQAKPSDSAKVVHQLSRFHRWVGKVTAGAYDTPDPLRITISEDNTINTSLNAIPVAFVSFKGTDRTIPVR